MSVAEISIYCSSCGHELKGDFTIVRMVASIEVEPCDNCMGEAREEGREEGEKSGYDTGHQDALDEEVNEYR